MSKRDPLGELAGKGFEAKDCTSLVYLDNVYATHSHEGDLEALYEAQRDQPVPLIGVLLSIVLGFALVALAIGAILIVIGGPAKAHEATTIAGQPLGWAYPYSCCSGMDCRPVEDVKETSTGYVVRTGEVISYSGDARLKDSPDGTFHLCTVGGLDTSKVICLFAPPRSF